MMPRRLAITGLYQTELLTYQDPPLHEHQVLVQTELASGKYGTTLAMFDNRTFDGQRFDQQTRLFLADPEASAQRQPTREHPWGTGTTGIGTIRAVGGEVSHWEVGDRVFGVMDIRETNICQDDQLWSLDDLDPNLALCIEPAYVAFHCIRESLVRYGDTVAVVGLGALGLLAVQMAKQAGSETVIAIDPLPQRRVMAVHLGADHALDPLTEDAALTTHHLTHGAGVDVAIELSGAYAALQTAIRCARVGGTVCSAGFYQGESHDLWLGREWHHNRLTVIVPHGCGWGHLPRDYPRWDTQRAYDCIVSLMRKGKLNAASLVNWTIPFEESVQLFSVIRERADEIIRYAVRFAVDQPPTP
jgi:threonine dehydrogenase-like Zn-dependent dehydrogenase